MPQPVTPGGDTPAAHPRPHLFTRVVAGYYRVLKVLLTVLMAVIIVPVTMQALSHNITAVPSYIWTEEIARFCFVWIIMIGAMIAVRDGTHFDVDILPDTMSARVNAAVNLFVHLAIFLVALTFLVYGYDFAELGSRQRSEISGLPMLSIYIAWPIAGASWVLFLVERVAVDLRKFAAGDAADPASSDGAA